MSTEENKAAERRLTEEVWNKRNPGAVDEFVAADVVEHNPILGLGPGREGFRQALNMVFAGFPDVQITVEDEIAEGDKVAPGDGRGNRYLPLRRRQAGRDLAVLGHPGPDAAAWCGAITEQCGESSGASTCIDPIAERLRRAREAHQHSLNPA